MAYAIVRLEVTWSEQLAVWLNAISPVLLGLGMLCLFIEFKTPGFGFFGIAGIALLAIVFLGHYVAGFSGHEPMLLFALGVVLVAVEIFFFPGVAVLAVSGFILMLGSLVWAMADIWPNEPISSSRRRVCPPLLNVALGLVIALVLAPCWPASCPKAGFATGWRDAAAWGARRRPPAWRRRSGAAAATVGGRARWSGGRALSRRADRDRWPPVRGQGRGGVGPTPASTIVV